jgi:predicted alpha/beta hydrolase
MGVKRRYYAKYAAFLAEQGFHVITYDYRGIGDSRNGSLRGFKAGFRDWGVTDQTAAIDWLMAQYPGQALFIVGHSLGGQIAGLTKYAAQVCGVLGVASQNGFWRGWSGYRKALIFALWHGIIPVVVTVFGYLPGRLLGAAESVPAQVAREWAFGGRHSNYILSIFASTPDDHYAELTAPFRLYSIDDDGYAPRQTVENLLPLYPAAQREHRHILPAEIGQQSIGHFGFFRPPLAATLWKETADWLKNIAL